MQDTASVMCCECHWRYPTQSWAILWGQPYSVDMLRLLSFSALPHIWIKKCSSHWVVAAAHFILSCKMWTVMNNNANIWCCSWFLMIFDHFPPCISKTVPYVFLYFRMIFACFFPIRCDSRSSPSRRVPVLLGSSVQLWSSGVARLV